MKTKSVKRILKSVTLIAFSAAFFFSSGNIVKAATSLQVTLSTSKPGMGSVNTQSSSLYVRSAPDPNASVITSLPSQSNIMLVERVNNSEYYKVQYDTWGHYGYVSGQYIYEWDMEHYRVANTGNQSLNMRSGDGTGFSVVASIPSGTAFPEETLVSPWSYSIYGPQEGFVHTQYTIKYSY